MSEPGLGRVFRDEYAAVVAALCGFGLRAGALRYGWSLPGFPDARRS